MRIQPFVSIVLFLVALPQPVRGDVQPTRLPLKEADLRPLLRTDFYGVYIDGKKTGFSKNALLKGKDAQHPSYIGLSQSEFKLTVTGVKSQRQFFESFEFDAQAPYACRSGRSWEADGKSNKEVRLRRTPKGFVVTIEAGGERREKEIPPVDFTLEDFLAPNLWLARHPKVGETLTTRTFDTDDLAITFETRKLLAIKDSPGQPKTWEVEVTKHKDKSTSVERYDATGSQLLFLKDDLLELRVEPEAQAVRNTEFSADLYETNKLRVDLPLGDPTTVTHLVLSISGQPAELLKSGPRQTVVKGGTGGILCRLGSGEGITLKASAKEITENLAETIAYPIHHAKIAAMVKEAIGDAHTPAEKVERLATFVNEYVEPSYTAEPLTVLDILKEKKGDCKHYAMLFTTLARAAGIPAREVSGVMYAGDDEKAFGPHRWNEVVLDGHWVPIDVSCGETEINAAHLRFGTDQDEAIRLATSGSKLKVKAIQVEHKK